MSAPSTGFIPNGDRVTILHFSGDVELIYTPETRRLKLQFPKGGGISRVLTEEEAKRLSKAMWYRS